MEDWLALVLPARRAEEPQQRDALTVGASVDCRFVRGDGRTAHRTWSADGLREVRSLQVFTNAFDGDEEERLVLDQRTADGPTRLLPMKIVERLAVRGVRRESFEPLIVEQGAPD